MPDIRDIPEVNDDDLEKLDKKANPEPEEKVDEPVVVEEESAKAGETDEPKEEENGSQEPSAEEIDYKKKFQESQRESIALRQSVIEKEKEIEKLSRPKEISENELKEKYPDWEEMTEREQKLARAYENTQIRLTNVEAKASVYHNEKIWAQKVDDQIKDWDTFQKYPRLVERKEDFKKFCQKPSHKNIDLDTLARSFLFEVKDDIAPKKKGSTIMTQNKSKGAIAPAKKKWTGDQVKALRENSPRKYQELVTKGEFDDLVED